MEDRLTGVFDGVGLMAVSIPAAETASWLYNWCHQPPPLSPPCSADSGGGVLAGWLAVQVWSPCR